MRNEEQPRPRSKPASLASTKGFTLVELLLTMALMGMFLVVLTDVVSSTLNVQTEAEAVSALSEDGRFLLARLDYDLQRATSITTPASLGSSGSTLVMDIGGVANTYALSSGNLQLTNGAGTTNLNSNEATVSDLSFQRLGNSGGKDTIRVSFTVTSVARTDQGQDSRTFTTTFGRRQ
jgi:prepilin-type N-terminal cleavage/methylation domain-containing protein